MQELPTELEQESQIEDYDTDMDELDENALLNAVVPKKSHPDSTALESTLQGSRKERLCKAGLQKEQTSISIVQKEQTSIPMIMLNPIKPILIVISEFTDSDIITKPHLL